MWLASRIVPGMNFDSATTLFFTIYAATSIQPCMASISVHVLSETTLADYNDDIGATGLTVVWYSDAAFQNVVTTTGDLAVGSYTYYAQVTNGDGCDSDTTLSITIDAAPSLTTSTDNNSEEQTREKRLADYHVDIGAGAGDTVVLYFYAAFQN